MKWLLVIIFSICSLSSSKAQNNLVYKLNLDREFAWIVWNFDRDLKEAGYKPKSYRSKKLTRVYIISLNNMLSPHSLRPLKRITALNFTIEELKAGAGQANACTLVHKIDKYGKRVMLWVFEEDNNRVTDAPIEMMAHICFYQTSLKILQELKSFLP